MQNTNFNPGKPDPRYGGGMIGNAVGQAVGGQMQPAVMPQQSPPFMQPGGNTGIVPPQGGWGKDFTGMSPGGYDQGAFGGGMNHFGGGESWGLGMPRAQQQQQQGWGAPMQPGQRPFDIRGWR